MITLWTTHDTPLGALILLGSPMGVTGLSFPGPMTGLDEADYQPAAFTLATQQLDQYLAGDRERFDLDVDLTAGTEFQRQVWRALQQIPYGTTITYTQLAEAIGRPDRLRAVAAAIARTPVPIIVPCHRVIGADGTLTGYGGGLERKRLLLDLEAGVLPLAPVG